MPLAGHGDVLGPVQPQPDRTTGQRRPQRGDGGETVRLHLLAAEAAAHPEALHRDVVAVQAEHVADDLLGLRRVLGAGLDEDLAALVDVGQRAVGLQVEVLLAAELEGAGEPVRRGLERLVGVAAGDHPLMALEALGGDRLRRGDQRRERLVLHHDRLGAEPGRLLGLTEHPADGVTVEHHLVGEQRLVVLDPGVVDPGHVGGGQHLDHPGDSVRRADVQLGDLGVGVRGLQRPGGQRSGQPVDQVVGVERLAGDVQRRGLVRHLQADDRVLRPVGQGGEGGVAHAWTSVRSPGFAARNFNNDVRSIAAR